jgi:hypothetical protein
MPSHHPFQGRNSFSALGSTVKNLPAKSKKTKVDFECKNCEINEGRRPASNHKSGGFHSAAFKKSRKATIALNGSIKSSENREDVDETSAFLLRGYKEISRLRRSPSSLTRVMSVYFVVIPEFTVDYRLPIIAL